MKSALKPSVILMLVLAACAASRPKEPWRIEVRTAGGFAGHGVGTYAVDSDGKVTVSMPGGNVCSYEATPDELRRIAGLLGDAHPREWKPAYLPENSCCDRIEYAMIVDEANVITHTRWIDDPPPMPADLVALADAIIGGAGSIRVASSDRCK